MSSNQDQTQQLCVLRARTPDSKEGHFLGVIVGEDEANQIAELLSEFYKDGVGYRLANPGFQITLVTGLGWVLTDPVPVPTEVEEADEDAGT
jgi:hypothetical protein